MFVRIWIDFLLLNNIVALSFNQPRFRSNVIWNSIATTFANESIFGSDSHSIFVNSKNSIYVPNRETDEILIWHNESSINPTKIRLDNLSYPLSIFVTTNGDIYVDVDKWIAENKTWITIMNVSTQSFCYGLFIDICDNLYCSMYDDHRVDKKWSSGTITMVAGTGVEGSSSDMLYDPHGIFVDVNLDLYVADCGNHRIQLFRLGERNGITVAGVGSAEVTIELNFPTGIILDGDRYLFIVDAGNSRIVGSDENGFRCIFGCSGQGSTNDKLFHPGSMSFDSHGNIYVTDDDNNRIQKVSLSNKSYLLTLSYNQPRFCLNTTWNLNATTFAKQAIVGRLPYGIFVNSKDSIYVVNQETGQVQIWHNENSINPSKTISGSLSYPLSIFVTTNGDIYVDNGRFNGRVDKWVAENEIWLSVMNVPALCTGLFIDIDENLYCSLRDNHRVDKKCSNGTITIVAGTGITGSSSDMLYDPHGIFVDVNLDLYVADCGNHRIQLFRLGERNGITVAGVGSAEVTIELNLPRGIVLDGDRYLFIVEAGNNRIVGSDENGFRCIFGCSGQGSTNDKLNAPGSMSFDSHGNIYVTDLGNNRVQKLIKNNNCVQPSITTQMTTGNSPSTSAIITSAAVSTVSQLAVTTPTIATSTIISTTTATTTKTVTSTTTKVASTTTTTVLTTAAPIQNTETTTITAMFTSSTSMIVSQSTMVTTTTTSIKNENCLPATIKLIPEMNSQTNAYQYRRSQDFYILSTIKLYCNQSSLTTKKWTIKNSTMNSSSEIEFDKKIVTSRSELYIPSNTLRYGIYKLELKVTMTEYPSLTSSSSVYVEISSSSATANLVPLGTSVVTSGNQQNLILNPGNYSKDPDGFQFHASDWYYEYFCRIYEANHQLSSINSCLSNGSNVFQYNNIQNSSLMIYPNVLQLGFQYQFAVRMSNLRSTSLVINSYVIVQIENAHRPMIAIGCVIQSLCSPNLEFQKVNPTTQIALFSYCVNQCENVKNILWNIYFGQVNSTLDFTKWILFDQMKDFENIWFYGRNTAKFTATNDLFMKFPNETHWKFEVIYSFQTINSSSALNFEINQPPSNGSCQINPRNGTTNTLFNITCFNWAIKENIKEYSLFTISKQIIAFSPIPTFEVRLPVDENLNLIIEIRDHMDGITQFNLSSVTVRKESFSDLFSNENQNIIGQMITIKTDEFNQIQNQIIKKAISNGMQLTSISISSLINQRILPNNQSTNQSARLEFLKEINYQANLRESLIKFTNELTITSVNSFKLQSLSLIQLSNATNQLTRTSLRFIFEKCFQLTEQLQLWLEKMPYEDVQIIVTQLLQCASNILTAVNGPLQKRIEVLEKDAKSATEFPEDYETDRANPNLFAQGNDFSLEKGRIFYFQKKLADEFNEKINHMISLLTSSLNLHINIGQKYTINKPEVFMSLETISVESLHNKMNFSSNLNPNQIISFRSMMEPMAIYGKSRIETHTNLSRSMAISILDENGNEIPFETSQSTLIEFFIPRDPNLEIPPMILTNQTFHYFNLTNDLPISIHFEIKANFSYLFIYKFDDYPIYNRSIQVNQSYFTYMIDNQQTIGHQFLIFGLQKKNSNVFEYEYRVYTSGCYYLNKENEWKSDGLRVGPKTNLFQTHCYSTHLTKFTGSLRIFPSSNDFDFVFANANFHRNKIIYLTVICVTMIYLIFLIYSYRKDFGTESIKFYRLCRFNQTLTNYSNDLSQFLLIFFAFICLRMFISIINDGFESARKNKDTS